MWCQGWWCNGGVAFNARDCFPIALQPFSPWALNYHDQVDVSCQSPFCVTLHLSRASLSLLLATFCCFPTCMQRVQDTRHNLGWTRGTSTVSPTRSPGQRSATRNRKWLMGQWLGEELDYCLSFWLFSVVIFMQDMTITFPGKARTVQQWVKTSHTAI